MMRKILSVFVFILGIVEFGVKAQDVFLSQPEIIPSMWNEKDWYNSDTRKYLFSHIYVSKSQQSPEKAAEVYEYVRVQREYRIKEDGTKYIRWFVDFNADRDAHPIHFGGNFYGIMLDNSVGNAYDLSYQVYNQNSVLVASESGTWANPDNWHNNSNRWFERGNKTYSGDLSGALYLYHEFYRRIVNDGGTAGNYNHRTYNYIRPVVHDATAQMKKILTMAQTTPFGQVFVNAGQTNTDNYRYIYQFSTDIIDDSKENYYIAFHNRNNGWAQHIIAFLPPEDGQKETIVYPKPKAKTIYTKVGGLPKPELGITNLTDFNGKKAVWEWTSPPDVSKVHTTEGTAKVTYYIDNEKVVMYVKIPVVVEASETHCLKPATTSGTALNAPFGITTTGRAGETADAWPMLRKGAWMVLESNNQGFVLTRMTTAQINAISQPQEGMLTYDITAKCLKLYDGKKWGCLNTKSCPQD